MSHSHTSQSVDLSHLLAFLTKTVAESCAIMHQNTFNIVMKQGNDPVTEIDFKIQYKIVTQIQKAFPAINIVGQEDLKLMDKITNANQSSQQVQFAQKSQITIPYQLFDLGTVVASELCIWIDPLDCTRGFVVNRRYECTINVGVTYKQRPIIGVIGQPYKKKSQNWANIENFQYFYKPTVTIGCISSLAQNSFELQVQANSWKRITFNNRFDSEQSSQSREKVEFLQKNGPKIAISSRRTSSTQNKLIKHLGAQKVFTGGAGHKILLVIRGEIEAMMLIGVETSWWDSCAGQAIIKSMGGFFIQPDLNTIGYNSGSDSYANKIGFLCVNKHQLYQSICSFLAKKDQKILDHEQVLIK